MTVDMVKELREKVRYANSLGFDGYCTDCESSTPVYDGRCGCGSGRVATADSLAQYDARRAVLSGGQP